MTFTFNVGIFLWPVSLAVTVIMLVVFRRRKLLGVTQKFIMSILFIDLCFVLTTAIRDTLLKAFDMNYGFLEYRVCSEVLHSIRFQMVLHATSAWFNTLMSVHHLLLVGFPFRVRICNLSAYFYTFLIVHSLFCCSLFFLITYEFQPIPLVQEYKPGYSLHIIEGCVPDLKQGGLKTTFFHCLLKTTPRTRIGLTALYGYKVRRISTESGDSMTVPKCQVSYRIT